MRTAADVYNRIRWDGSFRPNEFIIGYLDRFVGIVEVDFMTWEDLSRESTQRKFVPFHRVQYFKRGEEILWDKRNRIDSVFS